MPGPGCWGLLVEMRRSVLWVDCTAAGLAGVLVLLFHDWLGVLHGLPPALLLFIGAVNILYACYSFALAARANRPPSMIVVLVAGNFTWAAACLGLALHFLSSATAWGIAHLCGEALFVASLATLEWRWRADLLTRHPDALA